MITQEQREAFLEHIRKNPADREYFKSSPEEIRADKELVEAFFNMFDNSGYVASSDILKTIDEKLRDDKDIVIAAVRKDGREYKFASERLKVDRDVFLSAFEENTYSYFYAPEVFQHDREIALECMKRLVSNVYEDMPKMFRKEIAFVMAAVDQTLIDWLEYFGPTPDVTSWRFSSKLEDMAKELTTIYQDARNLWWEDHPDHRYKEYDELLEYIRLHYGKAIEEIAQRSGLPIPVFYQYLKEYPDGLIYLPPSMKQVDTQIEYDESMRALPLEVQMQIKKQMQPLPLMQVYNPSLTQNDSDTMSHELRDMMMAGIDDFEEIKNYLSLHLGELFDETIEEQWKVEPFHDLFENEFVEDEEDNLLKREGPWEAFDSSDIGIIYNALLSDAANSRMLSFVDCEECNKLFHPHMIDSFYYYEKDIHVCINCSGNEHNQRVSGMADYDRVSAIMGGGIPEEVVEGASPQDLMNRLKELIDAGYSKALARVLTMGGYHQNETDYLVENAQQYEEDVKNGNLTQEAYELYKQLLEESNDPDDLEYDEYEILRMIRITDY